MHHSLLHKLLGSGHAQSVTANSSTPASSVASSVHTSLYQQRSMVTTSFAYMPTTALATVLVSGRQCNARVLIDSGSGITLSLLRDLKPRSIVLSMRLPVSMEQSVSLRSTL